ncbi:MAG: ATP-binding cassette domain-containing protein [Desulfuromonadales bacterium]|nr:ATP-binding cassette domain-containing protein [Desulfuromonadales bacterium]
MSLIELKNVSKIYRLGSQEIHALTDLSLTFDEGEFAVLAGPSGSGKTTALNLIGCLDRPTAGQVLVDSLDLGTASSRQLADFRLQHIGFIFQSYNLIPVLTAAENAEFTLMLQRVPKKRRRERVCAIFAELGIDGLENRRPADLAGGQQQRVAIARALAADPQVILADEPTANLDSHSAEELLSLMRRLNQERGTTFIFSSHDDWVISQAKRVIRLEDGYLADDSCIAL